MQKEFHYSIHINADPEKVWDALTNPEMTKKFMYNCEPITNWQVGSPLIWRGAEDGIDYVKGNVVKFEPNTTLAFTVFNPHEDFEDIPENYLTSEYNLSASGSGTQIEIRQWDYETVQGGEMRYKDATTGWDSAMKALKELLEA